METASISDKGVVAMIDKFPVASSIPAETIFSFTQLDMVQICHVNLHLHALHTRKSYSLCHIHNLS